MRDAKTDVMIWTIMLASALATRQGTTAEQTSNGSLVLRGATIYTAPDSSPIRDGVVIVRNGKIEAVGAQTEVTLPSGVTTLDLSGHVLVAGFWNSHVHFMGSSPI
jgi:cytosine/adenosine deaminase-related metal-dependent hydrolase